MKHNLKNTLYKSLNFIKEKLFTKREVQHSEEYYKRIAFLNKYSLVFHMLIAMLIVFMVELISRRNIASAFSFVGTHTLAYVYNAFLVFASLTFVYLFKRRAFARVIISGFWVILGIINGCVLSNRVTPFGYTDLKCIPELLCHGRQTKTGSLCDLICRTDKHCPGLFAGWCLALWSGRCRFGYHLR